MRAATSLQRREIPETRWNSERALISHPRLRRIPQPLAMSKVSCTWMYLCVWVFGASGAPAGSRTGAKVALEDEVNVLMYGVLQLSESLHHVHQNTEAKLARVTRAVTHTESLVERLSRDAEQTVRSERQTKDRLGIIQAEVAELRVQAQQTRGLVYKVEREDVDLKHKLGHLDATLRRFRTEQIRAMKETTQRHNNLLQDLMSWTEKHKEQLEVQRQQLTELQKRTSRKL